MKIANLINGQWVEATGNQVLVTYNPATEEEVCRMNEAGVYEVDRAVTAAKEAFASWRKTPAPVRGDMMYKLAHLLTARKAQLSTLLTQEVGKVIFESEGEVQEAIDMAYYMAGEGRRMFGEVVPSEMPDKWAMAIREPIGVVAAISAFNFPIAVPSWKILPALILGNTVVWKPSPHTSGTAAMFAQCFQDAGFPPGVLNVITGGAAETGAYIVSHPDTHMISFTGSSKVGQQVYEAGARYMKRVSLELGGKNAIIVLEDADLELAAEAVVWAAFGTSGQRCTAASRLIVKESIYPSLMDKLLPIVKSLRIGNGIQREVQIGPLIHEQALHKVMQYVHDAREEGLQIICGGNRVEQKAGHFFEPTIIGPVHPKSKFAQEEIFGPILSVIVVQSFEEAIEVNNSVAYGLSSSIFTTDINTALKAVRELDSGIVYINHGTTGAEIQLPFGGTKHTGNGARESGQAALDAFSEWKSVYIDYSGRLQRAQIDKAGIEQGN